MAKPARPLPPLDLLRGFDEIAARRRGMCLLADPFYQLHAETALELADLQAHGRLGEVELACGGGEAFELDDLEESPQLIEVQAAHLKESFIDEI